MTGVELLVSPSVYQEICQLHSSYADAVNRRAWASLQSLFVDDALVDVQVGTSTIALHGPTAVGEFIDEATREMSFFSFVPMNVHVFTTIDAAAPVVQGRLFMCEHRQDRVRGHFDTVYGLYQDRFVLRDSRWCYAARYWQPLNHEAKRRSLPITLPSSRSDAVGGAGEFR